MLNGEKSLWERNETDGVLGPDGGIGRRAGFKIQFPQGSVGSIPTPGTKEEEADFLSDSSSFLRITGWYRLTRKNQWIHNF